MDIRDAHTLKEENKLILQNESVAYAQKNQDTNPISEIGGTSQCKKTSKHCRLTKLLWPIGDVKNLKSV